MIWIATEVDLIGHMLDFEVTTSDCDFWYQLRWKGASLLADLTGTPLAIEYFVLGDYCYPHESSLECRYIATCYPDDLQDHHCREGELLIYAFPPHTTINEVVQDLVEYANQQEVLPIWVSYQLLKQVIQECFADCTADDISWNANFKHSNNDLDCEVVIYAYLIWQE